MDSSLKGDLSAKFVVLWKGLKSNIAYRAIATATQARNLSVRPCDFDKYFPFYYFLGSVELEIQFQEFGMPRADFWVDAKCRGQQRAQSNKIAMTILCMRSISES